MYELKTQLPQFDIKLPTCMYKMKNVSLSGADITQNIGAANNGVVKQIATATVTTCNSVAHPAASATSSTKVTASTSLSNCACKLDLDKLGAQIQHLVKSSCNAGAVTRRQDKVLQQLEELKAQLAGIRSSLGINQTSTQHQAAQISGCNGGLREEPLQDIVINGHPKFIPYALLAIKNAWKDLYTLDVRTFTHSTMVDIGPEAKAFEKKLAEVPVNVTKPKVQISLIWKNCEHTEMISSPTMYVPIYGEVNIIRYLGRVGPLEYRYENSPLCNEIDAVLDICYQLLRCTTAKSIASLIRALNKRLQNQKYFGGEQMSIADIGVHSSLKRKTIIKDKDLTPALLEWRKRVQLLTSL